MQYGVFSYIIITLQWKLKAYTDTELYHIAALYGKITKI